MKLEKLVGDRFKERPADCVIDSHALMLRGGYMKHMTSGIYSQYPPLKRICQKIEQIIREEMDAIDGQEVLFPVVLPGTLWEESGRFTSVANELLRFKDRTGASMVLGMTHEEAAVHLVRDYAKTYTKYPFMIYQIQTKFRDEARPRAGLIRVREFTMKDAYSFHTSQEDLEAYYEQCFHAYERVFARAGIPEVITVASDSGMMGGSISHEYMLLTPIGEDSLAICAECDYRANVEAAECKVEHNHPLPMGELRKVETPHTTTIDSLCDFLHIHPENTCKAVVYQKNMTDEYVVIFLRGDLDVNETKLTKVLGEAVHPANITEDCGLVAGFIGPMNICDGVTVLYDNSLEAMENFVTGANDEGYHYTGMNLKRDVNPNPVYHDLAKAIEGGICPKCGKPALTVKNGIEVGNIFQLGTKYTKSMNMQYTDSEGNLQYPIMGCYGIGVGRLAASVCETCHDEYGPIWPITIAPWQVHLCCLRADDAATKAFADNLYKELQANGVEVIYDDRNVRPGAMFSDADLLGVPVRVIVSPRNMEASCVELKTRDKRVSKNVPLTDVVTEVKTLIQTLTDEIMEKV